MRDLYAFEDNAVRVVFTEDIYVYDLNQIQNPPLAYRSAKGGERLPELLELVGCSAREWLLWEDRLYGMPLYLSGNGGSVVLPVFGSMGRFAVVIKPTLSLSAFACLAQSACLENAYVDPELAALVPKVSERESDAIQAAARTVSLLQFLLDACKQAEDVYQVEECIRLAAQIWGVERMLPQTVEFSAMQGQYPLPDTQPLGQALAISLMVLLSVMRNLAHARSGWLYAVPCESGTVLQAVLRCAADVDLHCLKRLRTLLEDGGIAFGERTFCAPVKPPKQYAYMQRKITDPRHPFCTRCGCLDARCANCTAVQWAILPYVCDAALLGIKNYFDFSE